MFVRIESAYRISETWNVTDPGDGWTTDVQVVI